MYIDFCDRTTFIGGMEKEIRDAREEDGKSVSSIY
jgi:hypothetical protein